ncbi:MAG TPA: MFS transporter [Rubrobacteraceae bacterium]|nr:MFS transporter [Rubrobacteraceae bacterium]
MGEGETRAGRREWIGLAVIALPCLLYSMDLTVLELAVPKLSADLEPTSSQLLWIMDIYGFLLAGFLIPMGTLGDRIGRRRLLLVGAAAFGAASVLAAFSRSAEMLIAARALLGIAGATLAPSTLSLIRNMFQDDDQRTLAIGVWATSFSAGAAVGPLAGGLLLEFFPWGSVFLLAVPVMALLLVLGPVLLPEFRDPEAGRLDLTSAALSLAAVLAAVYGLKQIAQDGAGWLPALSIVAGIAVGVAFVLRQRRLADPLIDLRLFRAPAFDVSLAAFAISIFVIAGMFFFIAQYLQLVLGLSPLAAGLWTVPSAGGLIAGSMLAPLAVRRVRPAFVMAGGLALSAVGFAMLTRVESASGLAVLVIGSVALSLGIAPVGTLATDLIVGSAPPERAGAASGISETSAELGGALGIAVLGSIGTAVYRNQMAGALPDGVPHEAADAARDTLGAAVGVAGGLPDQTGSGLLDAAREAFTQGLQLTAVTSAALVTVLAVLVAVVLRDVRAGAGEQAGTGPEGAVADTRAPGIEEA